MAGPVVCGKERRPRAGSGAHERGRKTETAGSSDRRFHWEPVSQESKDRVRENIVAIPGNHMARPRRPHTPRPGRDLGNRLRLPGRRVRSSRRGRGASGRTAAPSRRGGAPPRRANFYSPSANRRETADPSANASGRSSRAEDFSSVRRARPASTVRQIGGDSLGGLLDRGEAVVGAVAHEALNVIDSRGFIFGTTSTRISPANTGSPGSRSARSDAMPPSDAPIETGTCPCSLAICRATAAASAAKSGNA